MQIIHTCTHIHTYIHTYIRINTHIHKNKQRIEENAEYVMRSNSNISTDKTRTARSTSPSPEGEDTVDSNMISTILQFATREPATASDAEYLRLSRACMRSRTASGSSRSTSSERGSHDDDEKLITADSSGQRQSDGKTTRRGKDSCGACAMAIAGSDGSPQDKSTFADGGKSASFDTESCDAQSVSATDFLTMIP